MEWKTSFDYELVGSSINQLVTELRGVHYGDFDKAMLEKVAYLKSQHHQGLPCFLNFNKDGFENFRLTPTQDYKWITMCEEGKDYRLEDQLIILEEVFRNDLNKSYDKVVRLLSRVPSYPESFDFDFDLESSDYSTLCMGELPSDQFLNIEPLNSLSLPPLKYRARTKLYKTSYGYVYISRQIDTVLVNHFSPADLCMFSDFTSIKKELDILSGSFITMGKPIEIGSRSVTIRDTILLAPGGAKALAKIGATYALPKLELTVEELNNMKLLRSANPELFTAYALRDSEITLTHASWMEAWHF